MQLQDLAAQTLPVDPPGRRSTRAEEWPGAWPDALSSRVLYRGAHLASSPGAARNARALVTAALADWRFFALLDDVVLCASELVGNAVLHADPSARADLSAGGSRRLVFVGVRCCVRSVLFLEVRDADARLPRLAGPDVSRLGGRGLFIVDALADGLSWGPVRGGGKVVCAWFNLARFGVEAASAAS